MLSNCARRVDQVDVLVRRRQAEVEWVVPAGWVDADSEREIVEGDVEADREQRD